MGDTPRKLIMKRSKELCMGKYRAHLLALIPLFTLFTLRLSLGFCLLMAVVTETLLTGRHAAVWSQDILMARSKLTEGKRTRRRRIIGQVARSSNSLLRTFLSDRSPRLAKTEK
jgi:hypothetical protein